MDPRVKKLSELLTSYSCRLQPGEKVLIDYEGEEFADPDTPASLLEKDELSGRVHSAMSHLTEIQVRRITLLAEGHSIREIARMEGIDHKVVAESIEGARKKFLKFF